MNTTGPLATGDIIWVTLPDVAGREQAGHRPALVVASSGYLAIVDTLVLAVPISRVDRGWPNHIPVTGPHGLAAASFVITEQIRAVSRRRITSISGSVDDECVDQVRLWLGDFLDIPLG